MILTSLLKERLPVTQLRQVVSLLGGGRDLQAAASAEAVPALLEATRALSGDAHPHCLQRVLCRISAQQQSLSLAPRLALQFLR